MYPHFKPAPADDGVKAYALCPFYIPTRMVLEEPNFGNKEGTGLEEATRNATKEIFKRSKSRMLTMEEVKGENAAKIYKTEIIRYLQIVAVIYLDKQLLASIY